MAGAWRTVRVFLSSTFRDMHAERDHLVKVTFPRLREWCQQQRLHLVDVDLRWGVTREQAEDGAAVDVCLREIDGSRPFFLCLLGGRYGWVPEPPPPERLYPLARAQRDGPVSITHLEVIHAALAPLPAAGGPAPPACEHAFFYLRDPACLPDPGALTGLTDGEREEYRAAFFEPLPQRRDSLDRLKAEIRRRFGPGGRVFDYAGTWDPGADNPEDESLRGRLTDLGALGRRVEADLAAAIGAEFRGHIAAALAGADDPLAAERAEHEAFAEGRTRVYVPRPDLEAALDGYAAGGDDRPLVLSGPPGGGKSAALARWAAGAAGRGGAAVLARFVGASAASVSLPRLLAGLCAELRERSGLADEVPADPRELERRWPEFLAAAAGRGPVVLVLDAVNQLDRGADPARLAWLPRRLPPGARLVVSALDHGPRSEPGRPPAPGEPPDWLAALRRLGLPEVRVPALTAQERRRMIREVPSVFAKTLGEGQVSALLQNRATGNPLFLAVALEELRVYGGFGREGERLTGAIRRLPWLADGGPGDAPPAPGGAPVVGAIDDALDALFGQVLDRLDRETARRAPGLSPAAFRLLATARDGLSEGELSGALARVLPGVAAEVREGEMQAVLRQVRPYLVRKGVRQRLSELDHPPDGFDESAPADRVTPPARQVVLLDFFHRSFWKAVRAKYLGSDGALARSHRELADYFRDEAEQPWFWESAEGQRRRARRLPPTPRPGNVRKAAELPYHVLGVARLAGGGDPAAPEWDAVADLLTDLNFLEAKAEADA